MVVYAFNPRIPEVEAGGYLCEFSCNTAKPCLEQKIKKRMLSMKGIQWGWIQKRDRRSMDEYDQNTLYACTKFSNSK